MYPTSEAAAKLGIAAQLLRELSQPDRFESYLGIEKAGGRRLYSDYSLTVIRLIRQLNSQEGLTYPQILERFQRDGVQAVMDSHLGALEQARVLAADRDRLEKEVSDLLGQLAAAQQVAIKWHRARANGAMALRRMEERKGAAERDMALLDMEHKAALRHVAQARTELEKGRWRLLFTGGYTRAVVQAQNAQDSLQSITNRMQELQNTMHTLSSLEVRQLLELGTGDTEVIEVETPAAADAPPRDQASSE